MKTNLILAAAGALTLLCASCEKNETPADDVFGGEGNVLIETTVKNTDGASGQSYLQQIPQLSGDINMTEGIQIGFSSSLSFLGNHVFIFPEFGTNSKQNILKYEHTAKGLKPAGELQIIPNSYPVNLSAVSGEKAYIPMYNLGKVMVINPATMESLGEIDLTGYAHGDSSADPAAGLVSDGCYYLPLDQINSSWMPYEDHRQVDVAVIDCATDKVLKVISEKASGMSFPTRPINMDMIFADEQQDIYVACTGYFGYNPEHLENGFVCISSATKDFDAARTWEISGTAIEGSEYKSASVYNCKYIGNGLVAAYVGIVELMGDNPYTARNAMAVMMDLNKHTIRKIDGIPYSDGHSVAIEYHGGEVYFSAYGVEKAGVFSYNPETGAVRQPISLSGNLTYIHFFE